jgi:Ala-tRNA(Pro) deacylase
MTIAATVKSHLEEKGVDYEVVTHPTSGSTQETAEAAQVDQGHLAKGVILTDREGAVMVVIPGDCWVKLAAVQKELDRELALAAEDAAAKRFPDCTPGALPPLGPAYGIETLLDKAVISLAHVYFESGDHRTLLKVRGEDFAELLSGCRRGYFCHED